MISSEKLAQIKIMTIKAAKYGFTFSSGVLLGTIVGVVLFFKISDGDI